MLTGLRPSPCAAVGVVARRGKFIFISEEEMGAVAGYIKKKGRVSIAELAAGIGREGLIKMSDDTQED